jgi:hypothetical protein
MCKYYASKGIVARVKWPVRNGDSDYNIESRSNVAFKPFSGMCWVMAAIKSSVENSPARHGPCFGAPRSGITYFLALPLNFTFVTLPLYAKGTL